MKKTLLLAALVGFAMTSCKKVYTCECTSTSKTTINGVTTTGTPGTYSADSGKMKKADAETWCEQDNGTTTSGTSTNGVEVTVACELK